MIEFKERDVAGGWSVEVWANGVLLGHIRRHGLHDCFVYYKGPDNVLNWSLQDLNLNAIKARIEASIK